MTDVFTKEKRSRIMSKIKKTDSKPERIVREYLFKKGLRFRKNVRTLPGCPDIVLKKYSAIVFVNGCFWHGHKNCKLNKPPKSNTNYWGPKIRGNSERDKKNKKLLRKLKWRVLTVWECQLINENRDNILNHIFNRIIEQE